MDVLERVDIRQEVEGNYDCYYDFLDMVSFEISKYFRPHLPFRNNQGILLDDPSVLTRDIYNLTDQFFKAKCGMNQDKVNYDQFSSFFVQAYKEYLPGEEGEKGMNAREIQIMEEDLMDVITDTARREIY